LLLVVFSRSAGQGEYAAPEVPEPHVVASAQPRHLSVPDHALPLAFIEALELPGSDEHKKQKDPAYKIYKDGYNFILDEKWEAARKKFAEVVGQHPASEYIDDAEYWSAFAMEHLDRDKDRAFTAFKSFIQKYPESNYYDDAVSEMYKLKGTTLSIGSARGTVWTPARVLAPGLAVSVTDSGMFFAKPPVGNGYRYRYELMPQMRHSARTVEALSRHLSSAGTLAHTPRAPGIPRGLFLEDEKLDPDTKLKMDALYALGDTKEDSLSFATLRDVAVDPKQPTRLREAAMDALSDFQKFNVLSVYLDVAKRDTSEEIQNMAIDYIGQLSSDKNKSVTALIDLFSVIPTYRIEKLQAVMWSIGEIGNRRAVAFLGKTARTHENYTLRSDAIYYLGNIGGPEARQALYDILKGK
jgi:hypothetical protein